MLAILAPVPAEILEGAMQVEYPEGRVAFGTGSLEGDNTGAWSFEFFSQEEIAGRKGEIPVLIYGSATDLKGPHELHRPGYVTAIGTYQDIRASKAGKHPHPQYRPKIALAGDTPYPLFWEVSNFRALPPAAQVPLSKLKLSGTGKLKPYEAAPPRGPQMVFVPEEVRSMLDFIS